MLNSQPLIDKICNKINQGGLTELETCQTSNALNLLSNPVVSVPTRNDLPDFVVYIDRMIYVNDENRYYYSNGYSWLTDFTSDISVINDAVWSWGFNSTGQLGDNTALNKSSPVSVVGNIIDWAQVNAGTQFSLAIRSDGRAWAWGCNTNGQLGDNTALNKSSPVSVVGGFTDWCQVSAGGAHSLGVRTNGTLWSWGLNSCGQLGDNSLISKISPVSVVGGFTDWCQVSAGCCHSLGVRTDGTTWAWGSNTAGQLGDNTIANKSSPVSVVGGFTDWCQVSAGQLHSLGLRTNGTAWAWGCNGQGRLGNGTVANSSSPVSVVGGFTDWCQVDAGNVHSLGLRTNGTLWAWGCNTHGQLGDNTIVSKSSPVSVVGGFTDWCQVNAGDCFTLGIRTNGTLWSWGAGTCGRPGDGTTTARSSPVLVAGGFSDWCQASAGVTHSLAIRRILKGF